MLISGIEHIDRQAWLQLVRESPTATWFQTPEAYDFYASLPQMMTPFVIAVTRQSSENPPLSNSPLSAASPLSEASPLTNPPLIKGLVLGYVTRDHNPLKQFFSRRAIIYGGPLLADDITDDELKELLYSLSAASPLKDPPLEDSPLSAASPLKNPPLEDSPLSAASPLKNPPLEDSPLSAASPLKNSPLEDPPLTSPIYVETRNFADFSRWRHVFEQCGFRYQPHYDMFIDCSDRDAMLARIHESKLRQIRKAQNEGVEIVEATSGHEVAEFYSLLKTLYQKKVRKPLFNEEFFTTFVAQKRGVLLLAKRDDKVIGGMLCPILSGKALYEWYVVGPAIVTWAAMNYANNHHLPLFDLMGAGEPDVPYGVRDFKLQFGGELHEFGRFTNVNSLILYRIGKAVISITRRLNLLFF